MWAFMTPSARAHAADAGGVTALFLLGVVLAVGTIPLHYTAVTHSPLSEDSQTVHSSC